MRSCPALYRLQFTTARRRNAINLGDAKTGPRTAPLGSAARALLDGLPGARRPCAFLFPAHATNKRRQELVRDRWQAMCREAGIGKAPFHDLRHSYVSQGIMNGMGLPSGGGCLGTGGLPTTAIYAHLDDAVPHTAAEKAAGRISKARGFKAETLPEG